jgi:hypothetical protein
MKWRKAAARRQQSLNDGRRKETEKRIEIQGNNSSKTRNLNIKRTLSRGRRTRSKSDHFYSWIAGPGGVVKVSKELPKGCAYGGKAHAVSERARDRLSVRQKCRDESEKKKEVVVGRENSKSTKSKSQRHTVAD